MGEEMTEIPNSFEDFFDAQKQSQKQNNSSNNFSEEENSEIESLKKKFESQRSDWDTKINKMSQDIKSLNGVLTLQNYIYSDRQKAIDDYHFFKTTYIKLNKKYRKEFANKHDFYTWHSQRRYPNEKTKINKILVELELIYVKKEILGEHLNFLLRTIQTLDNIIYGIKYRLEIEHLNRGS